MNLGKQGSEIYEQESFATDRYILCRNLLSRILM